MPAGLQIFNTGGVIQIDENFQNYGLIATGTVAAYSLSDTTLPTPTTMTGVDVYTASTTEIVAVRATGVACLHSITASGAGLRYIYGVPSGTTLTYYRFGLGVFSSSRAGLQVFNSAGSLVFDAGSPSLRVTSLVQNANYNNILGNYVWDTNKTFAAVFGYRSGIFRQLIEPAGNQYVEIFAWNSPGCLSIGGGLNFQVRQYWTRNGQPVSSNPPQKGYISLPFSALIVDVTGF